MSRITSRVIRSPGACRQRREVELRQGGHLLGVEGHDQSPSWSRSRAPGPPARGQPPPRPPRWSGRRPRSRRAAGGSPRGRSAGTLLVAPVALARDRERVARDLVEVERDHPDAWTAHREERRRPRSRDWPRSRRCRDRADTPSRPRTRPDSVTRPPATRRSCGPVEPRANTGVPRSVGPSSPSGAAGRPWRFTRSSASPSSKSWATQLGPLRAALAEGHVDGAPPITT